MNTNNRPLSQICNMDLHKLCVLNDWFTCGTIRQYDKLFELNVSYATIIELTSAIWLCSDEKWLHCEIYDIIKNYIEITK